MKVAEVKEHVVCVRRKKECKQVMEKVENKKAV